MRKGWIGCLLAAIASAAIPAGGRADIVEKKLDEAGEAGAYVLQGSRNMRRLGKSRRVSARALPSVPAAVTVIPALENEALRPRPRFGFGSDWQPGGAKPAEAAVPEAVPPIETPSESVFQPSAVYQFRYHYPVHREYWIGSPFRYYAPCAPRWYSGYRHHRYFFRFSFP